MRNQLFIITVMAISGRMTAAPPGIIADFDLVPNKRFLPLSADDPYHDVSDLDKKVFSALDDYLDLEIERINREAAEAVDEIWPHLDHGLKIPYRRPSVKDIRGSDRIKSRRIKADRGPILTRIKHLEKKLDERLDEIYRELPKVENLGDGDSIKDQLWFLSTKAFPIEVVRNLARLEPIYASGISEEARRLCPNDPLRNRLMERQMQAILRRTDDSLRQRHRVRSIFHHMLSCLNEDSYLQFDMALYAASRTIERRLIKADLKYLIPHFQMTLLPVMLSSYDSIKYFGKTSGSYRWLERWWSVLVEMIKKGQHPFEQDLLLVMDIYTARTVGVRIYCDDGGQGRDCVNFPAFLRSLADPARLGVGACGNLEMIRSGVVSLGGTLGYNCSIGVCSPSSIQVWEMIPKEAPSLDPSDMLDPNAKTYRANPKSPFGVPMQELRDKLCLPNGRDNPFDAAPPKARMGPSSGFNACAGFPKKILPNGICGFSASQGYGSPGSFSCGISVPSACNSGLEGMFETTASIGAVKDPQCTISGYDQQRQEQENDGEDSQSESDPYAYCETDPDPFCPDYNTDEHEDDNGTDEHDNNGDTGNGHYDEPTELSSDSGFSPARPSDNSNGSGSEGSDGEGGATPDDDQDPEPEDDDPDNSWQDWFDSFGDEPNDEGATPSEDQSTTDDAPDPEIRGAFEEAFGENEAEDEAYGEEEAEAEDEAYAEAEPPKGGGGGGGGGSSTTTGGSSRSYEDELNDDFDNTSADLENNDLPDGGSNTGSSGGEAKKPGKHANHTTADESIPGMKDSPPVGRGPNSAADRIAPRAPGYRAQTHDGLCPRNGKCRLVNESSGGEIHCVLSDGAPRCHFAKVPAGLKEACRKNDSTFTCRQKVKAIEFFRKNGAANFKKFIKLLNDARKRKHTRSKSKGLEKPVMTVEKKAMMKEYIKAVRDMTLISKQVITKRRGKPVHGYATSNGVRKHKIHVNRDSAFWQPDYGHNILIHEGTHVMIAVMMFNRGIWFTAKEQHKPIICTVVPVQDCRKPVILMPSVYLNQKFKGIRIPPLDDHGHKKSGKKKSGDNNSGQQKSGGNGGNRNGGGGGRLTDGNDSCTALSNQMRRFRSCVNNVAAIPGIPRGGEDFEIVPGITGSPSDSRSCVPTNPVTFNRSCLWSYCSDNPHGNCCGATSAGSIDFDRVMERQCYDVYCPSGQVVMDGGGCRCNSGDNSLVGEQELLDSVLGPNSKVPVGPEVDPIDLIK